MKIIIDLGNRYFKQITNLVFVFAVIIFCFEIVGFGFSLKALEKFALIYKPSNFILSILSVLMSWYLVLISKNIYIKIARVLFLVISTLYLFISFFWWLSLLDDIFDVEGFRLFLSLFIGFMAISFKIATLGNTKIHPALLFILSFIFLIIFGGLCLLLPSASNQPITFLQALFTSTSAVTVTGLAVLDTGKDFTTFGQVIILILIQLGGLGILTITNVFALIFKSSTSFRNRMMLSDMIKELDNNNTFSTLFKIILFTFCIEGIGAILIYISISGSYITSHPVFFAVFHSISGFCNAGFSTMTNSLYEDPVKYNYFFQLVIVWLLVTGGISYSVMINHYAILKNKLKHGLSYFKANRRKVKKELVRQSTNNKIIIKTTYLLLIIGTILFMLAEFDGVLKEHDLWGKIVVSIFNSATPRTAGFNNVNMSQLGLSATMLIMVLMWIGASPGSTGGGIKTTTFAISMLNLWNQIIGKDKLVYNNKEIPANAINQVSAVILLSIFAISLGAFMISYFDSKLLFKDILFECISAYSTVGLSIGITASLSPTSQCIIIILMFLGRVSFLTFLIGLLSVIFEEKKEVDVYYPKGNIFIN